MSKALYIFFAAALIFRLGALFVSIKNERALKVRGALEFGDTNSAVLAALHTALYLSAFSEGILRSAKFDRLSVVGGIVYLFGVLALLHVMQIMGRLWTVKLLIAADHELVRNGAFAYLKHPNYILAIIPELIGFCIVFHSWLTLAIGLPLYGIVLGRRIRLEEQVMSRRFTDYGNGVSCPD